VLIIWRQRIWFLQTSSSLTIRFCFLQKLILTIMNPVPVLNYAQCNKNFIWVSKAPKSILVSIAWHGTVDETSFLIPLEMTKTKYRWQDSSSDFQWAKYETCKQKTAEYKAKSISAAHEVNQALERQSSTQKPRTTKIEHQVIKCFIVLCQTYQPSQARSNFQLLLQCVSQLLKFLKWKGETILIRLCLPMVTNGVG
jgi:hypothetical protein